MNKKQILKEQKRIKEERKQVSRLFEDDKDAYSDLIKIGLGVVAFIGLAFVLINFMNGNWNLFNKKNVVQEEVDNTMVMVGTMFNKETDKYLVLAYDMKEENNVLYAALADNYSGNMKLYFLDLSNGFNRSFVGDKANITSDLDNLKFSGPTLLLINKDKIEKAYTTENEITNYFR